MTFDPEVFFNILLPPIIFHAGYSLKRVIKLKRISVLPMLGFNNAFLCPTETFFQKHRLHPGLRLHGNTDLLLRYWVGFTHTLTVLVFYSDSSCARLLSPQTDHVRLCVVHESCGPTWRRLLLH